MKNINIFIVVFVIILSSCTPQVTKLYGTYEEQDTGDHFVFNDSIFVFVAWQNKFFDILTADTIASGTFNIIDNVIVELNGCNFISEPDKNYNITTEWRNDISKDSIMIELSFPHHLPLEIIIWDTYIKYEKGKKEFFIIPRPDKNCGQLSFIIKPSGYAPHFNGIYFGRSLIVFEDYDNKYNLQNGYNYISISNPYITDEHFEQICIYKEYAYFKGNAIYWRGKKFVKKENYKHKSIIYIDLDE